MKKKEIQDILSLVEQPSRYLGNEVNVSRKDHDAVKLRMVLAFPDLYEIGTSHFGIQILYHILNASPDIAAERVFAPGVDMEAHLRENGLSLTSLESRRPLAEFDIIGISLLYELNYTNMLTILDLANIPFYAADRGEDAPFIIAGGACTCNPEPVADVFDAIVVGDGEAVIMEMAEAWMAWRESGAGKASLLVEWSRINGVYVPALFEPVYDATGAQTVKPRRADYTHVNRAVIADLDEAPLPEAPVLPYARPVHDRLRLEVARGCTNGCRFCQAGMIYRPVRERSPERLLALSDAALAKTGYEDISLLSLSTGDYRCIAPLMARLMRRYAGDHVALSLPSLRAGTLTPELMAEIRKVRKTGFTIAPEAGSQRLRDVINKKITEADIFRTVGDAFAAGWQVIKLYFMVGMPTETDADLQAIVDLVKKLRAIKSDIPGPAKGKPKIHVSVGTFIPKPHTPFQWCRQISLEESREKITWLKDALRMPGVQFKWQNPEVSMLEGVWSRGDRRLSKSLVRAFGKGCRFDGWTDHFRLDLWLESFDETGIDIPFYIHRDRATDEPLPWDHIHAGADKSFLLKEWQAALAERPTPDCRDGACQNCGVCDFDEIRPRVHTPSDRPFSDDETTEQPEVKPSETKSLEVRYAKLGSARFLGHLEMVSIFVRAIRRAKIPVLYSGGFHPMPKLSFNDPLPIGMESQEERFYMTVPDTVEPMPVPTLLNNELPDGLEVLDCRLAPPKKQRTAATEIRYQARMDGGFTKEALRAYEAREAWVVRRENKKGMDRSVDLKSVLKEVAVMDDGALGMTIDKVAGKGLRPAEVLGEIFGLDAERLRTVRVTKLAEPGM